MDNNKDIKTAEQEIREEIERTKIGLHGDFGQSNDPLSYLRGKQSGLAFTFPLFKGASQQCAALKEENERMKAERSVIYYRTRIEQKDHRISELEEQIRLKDEALRIILERDFSAMLASVPEGVIHRADVYNSADHFEDNGSYEEYARYTAPAQNKMIDAFINKALNP